MALQLTILATVVTLRKNSIVLSKTLKPRAHFDGGAKEVRESPAAVVTAAVRRASAAPHSGLEMLKNN